MATQIQIRRDTAANWTSGNPILAQGEPALETDTLKEKIGDGVTAWNLLAYKTGGGSAAQTTYDPSGETGGNVDADKTNVQTGLKEVRDFANQQGKALGTFTPAMTFNNQGQYTDYAPSVDTELTAINIVPFNVQVVRITVDGIIDITFGAGIDKVITQFTNPLPAGSYWFYMASFISPGGSGAGVHVSIPEVQSAIATVPIITSITITNIAPSDVVMVGTEVMTGTNLGFSLSGTTSATFSSLSGTGTNVLTGVLATPAAEGETILLSYDEGTGDIQGTDSPLASITNQAVTNLVGGVKIADFNGSTSHVTADAQHTALQFSDGVNDDAFSLSFTIKPTAVQGDFNWLLRLPTTETPANGIYEVILLASGQIQFNIYTGPLGTVFINAISTGTMNLNALNNIVVTYDGSGTNTGMNIYIDTVLDSVTRDSAGVYERMILPDSLARFQIGWIESGLYYYDGGMSDAAAWSTELTLAEVGEIVDGSGLTTDLLTHSQAANLQMWLQFNEDTLDSGTNSLAFTGTDITYIDAL